MKVKMGIGQTFVMVKNGKVYTVIDRNEKTGYKVKPLIKGKVESMKFNESIVLVKL